MARRFLNTTTDQANFSECLLRCMTLPLSLIRKMRENRGNIERDLGIKTVAIYTLCSTVLGRVAHVPSHVKRSDAVRKIDVILTGGITKKKKSFNRGHGRLETRDRTISYIVKCINSYIASDLEATFGDEYSCVDLHGDVCRGDDLVGELLSAMDDCPSFQHILPVSLLSLVWLFAECMLLATIESVPNIDVQSFLVCDAFQMYGALEHVTTEGLKPLHPCVGVLVGGDGRPSLPASSFFGRDGEIMKIGLSNTVLTRLLVLGSKMRTAPRSGTVRQIHNDTTLGLDTFFPFLLDAMARRRRDGRAFETVMRRAEEVLRSSPDDCLVLKNHVLSFSASYETLLKCNRVFIRTWKGQGVLHRTRYIPDVVRNRMCGNKEICGSVTADITAEFEGDLRACRARSDACLDSPQEFVRGDGKKVVRYFYGDSVEICRFLHSCLRLADKIRRRSRDIPAGGDAIPDILRRFRRLLFRELVMGLFACDLSGNMSMLYEEYIYSSLMRHFDERKGAALGLQSAGMRRTAVREKKGSRKRSTRDIAVVAPSGRNIFDSAEEEWGPPDL